MTIKTNGHPRTSQLIPGFFMGGFECSTPINVRGHRVDELALTGHDRNVREDYRLLRACGMGAARDGVRWNLIDQRGKLDFTSVLSYIDAAEAAGVAVIWDLFHYGYPDDLDPFEDTFIERFCAYCHAFARLLARRGHGERWRGAPGMRFYTPVNEISYYAWAGGEVGMFAPFRRSHAAEFKRRLAQAAIRGIDAIKQADPLARFVHCDPLVHVVAPADAPWLEDEARYFNDHFVCEAWDILAGRLNPELGGSPAHLDIIGVNYYGLNQWEHQRPGNVLAADDPRRKPFSEMLYDLWLRYERPIIVTETASIGDDRPRWLDHMARECLRARRMGVDLHGLCIYPVIGMTDWDNGEFRPMGLWDRSYASPTERVPHAPTMSVLKRFQRRFVAPVIARPARSIPATVWPDM